MSDDPRGYRMGPDQDADLSRTRENARRRAEVAFPPPDAPGSWNENELRRLGWIKRAEVLAAIESTREALPHAAHKCARCGGAWYGLDRLRAELEDL